MHYFLVVSSELMISDSFKIFSFEGGFYENNKSPESRDFERAVALFNIESGRGSPPYVCRLCPFFTHQFSQMEKHSKKHCIDRPFKCDTCGKGFTKKWHYKIHLRVHTGEKPYTCDLCPSKFSDPSAFRRHQAVHREAQLSAML